MGGEVFVFIMYTVPCTKAMLPFPFWFYQDPNRLPVPAYSLSSNPMKSDQAREPGMAGSKGISTVRVPGLRSTWHTRCRYSVSRGLCPWYLPGGRGLLVRSVSPRHRSSPSQRFPTSGRGTAVWGPGASRRSTLARRYRTGILLQDDHLKRKTGRQEGLP